MMVVQSAAIVAAVYDRRNLKLLLAAGTASYAGTAESQQHRSNLSPTKSKPVQPNPTFFEKKYFLFYALHQPDGALGAHVCGSPPCLFRRLVGPRVATLAPFPLILTFSPNGGEGGASGAQEQTILTPNQPINAKKQTKNKPIPTEKIQPSKGPPPPRETEMKKEECKMKKVKRQTAVIDRRYSNQLCVFAPLRENRAKLAFCLLLGRG